MQQMPIHQIMETQMHIMEIVHLQEIHKIPEEIKMKQEEEETLELVEETVEDFKPSKDQVEDWDDFRKSSKK